MTDEDELTMQAALEKVLNRTMISMAYEMHRENERARAQFSKTMDEVVAALVRLGDRIDVLTAQLEVMQRDPGEDWWRNTGT